MRTMAWGIVLVAIVSGCGAKPDDGADPNVTSKGSMEVTARLVDVRGEFPPNDLYDYAYVMRYEVLQNHRGETPKTILVGHYNPLKHRATVADARSGDVGGNATTFKVGDMHRMALEVPIDEYSMVGIINKYAEETQEPIYWAVWTNKVVQ